eukprot:358790-Chlamydomonas_euryale.AAC.4
MWPPRCPPQQAQTPACPRKPQIAGQSFQPDMHSHQTYAANIDMCSQHRRVQPTYAGAANKAGAHERAQPIYVRIQPKKIGAANVGVCSQLWRVQPTDMDSAAGRPWEVHATYATHAACRTCRTHPRKLRCMARLLLQWQCAVLRVQSAGRPALQPPVLVASCNFAMFGPRQEPCIALQAVGRSREHDVGRGGHRHCCSHSRCRCRRCSSNAGAAHEQSSITNGHPLKMVRLAWPPDRLQSCRCRGHRCRCQHGRQLASRTCRRRRSRPAAAASAAAPAPVPAPAARPAAVPASDGAAGEPLLASTSAAAAAGVRAVSGGVAGPSA